ncbi:MAG TPA: ImmA/IrrE family metallo-endopeptidase [Bacteroidales bacterium]|nr:ImmA/IrrE family metallo-endopeptidase [Bacteroidales bacterium]
MKIINIGGNNMSRVTVDVNPDVLQWAIDKKGKGDIKNKFPKIDEWLNGISKPTIHQLENFAKYVSVPFGYLLLSKPPVENAPLTHFRTLPGSNENISSELYETIMELKRRQSWMREYLIDNGYKPLTFVGSKINNKSVKIIVEDIKSTLKLPHNWAEKQPNWQAALEFLQKKVEEIGIVVIKSGIVGNNTHRKLNVSEFRGFVLVDEYVPFIFINAADSKSAQMFTIAHELAHIWLGISASFDLHNLQPAKDEIEQICDKVAAEFLVPEDSLRNSLNEIKIQLQSDIYKFLSRKFKVSEIVCARRLLDLGLITKDVFSEFYNNYQKKEKTTNQEGGNFYATLNLRLGRRFSETVIQAVKEGKLLYKEAYRLTGCYGKTFDDFMLKKYSV